MKRWTIRFECVDDDESQTPLVVQVVGSHDGNHECQIPEMASVAGDMAMMLCAIESLGPFVPCHGEKVLDSFSLSFREDYRYWADADPDDSGGPT